jgi:hypothetical protein
MYIHVIEVYTRHPCMDRSSIYVHMPCMFLHVFKLYTSHPGIHTSSMYVHAIHIYRCHACSYMSSSGPCFSPCRPPSRLWSCCGSWLLWTPPSMRGSMTREGSVMLPISWWSWLTGLSPLLAFLMVKEYHERQHEAGGTE